MEFPFVEKERKNGEEYQRSGFGWVNSEILRHPSEYVDYVVGYSSVQRRGI